MSETTVARRVVYGEARALVTSDAVLTPEELEACKALARTSHDTSVVQGLTPTDGEFRFLLGPVYRAFANNDDCWAHTFGWSKEVETERQTCQRCGDTSPNCVEVNGLVTCPGCFD